jgi:PTH1 family peptidyl-tRNA hydrolase
MTLFVGLGNPGPAYEMTRHNIGWRVIDHLISDLDARDISKNSFHGELYRHGNLFFLKPTTYMNLSGKSLQAVKQFFKIDTEDIVVIHDDIDLPFGAVRFKQSGGNGGHNGLKSIDAIGDKGYYRIRVGVGKPEHKSQVSDYVLHSFDPEEEKNLETLIPHIANAATALAKKPFDEVRTHYSLKPKAAL